MKGKTKKRIKTYKNIQTYCDSKQTDDELTQRLKPADREMSVQIKCACLIFRGPEDYTVYEKCYRRYVHDGV